jgi:hypothetical protein
MLRGSLASTDLTLVLDDTHFAVNKEFLASKLSLFRGNCVVNVLFEWIIQSAVTPKDFQAFVQCLLTDDFQITVENHGGLTELAREFGFDALADAWASFIPPPSSTDSELYHRLVALEKWRS